LVETFDGGWELVFGFHGGLEKVVGNGGRGGIGDVFGRFLGGFDELDLDLDAAFA
jgi:hypothetical protein